jgi:hypothetical protein
MKKIDEILILFLITLYSCNNTKCDVKFPQTKKMECEIVPNSPFLGLPICLSYYDQKLFVTDFYGNNFIHVYDLKIKKEDIKFAPKGKGPKEFLSPLISKINDNRLYVLNKKNYRLGWFNLDGTLIDSLYLYKDLCTVPNSIIKFIPIDDSRFIVSGYFNESRFAIVDSNGQITSYFGTYPEFASNETSIPYNAKAMFHQCRFTSNQSKRLFAAASNHVLDIWDYSTTIPKCKVRLLLADYNYSFTTGNILSTTETSNTIKGVRSICSNNSYIFMILNPNDQRTNNKINEVWIFDWDGNPVENVLPDMNIDLIESINDSVIYGIANNPSPVIIKMDINK